MYGPKTSKLLLLGSMEKCMKKKSNISIFSTYARKLTFFFFQTKISKCRDWRDQAWIWNMKCCKFFLYDNSRDLWIFSCNCYCRSIRQHCFLGVNSWDGGKIDHTGTRYLKTEFLWHKLFRIKKYLGKYMVNHFKNVIKIHSLQSSVFKKQKILKKFWQRKMQIYHKYHEYYISLLVSESKIL